MKSKKLHRLVGLILLLPMVGWTITGFIFFVKPGYQGAYEQLGVKSYPLEQPLVISPSGNWQEARLIRTVLGYHLLVKEAGKTQHLNPATQQPMAAPSTEQLRLLVEDAISANKARYGDIDKITDTQVTTTTAVEINLNWDSLRLSQRGNDTWLINTLYKIHYLQWSPSKGLNQILGMAGLLLLLLLTLLGFKMSRRKPIKGSS